jgi:hypothetical protein
LLGSPGPWQDDFQALASWLKSIEPQLAACAAGSRRKFFARPIDQNARVMLDLSLPGVNSSQAAGRALFAKAWQSDGLFDGAEFSKQVSVLLRLANHMHQGPAVIDQVRALGMRSLVYTAILEALEGNWLKSTHAQQLESLLEQEDAIDCVTAMDRAIVFELAHTYDNLQLWSTQGGTISPKFSSQSAAEAKKLAQEKGWPAIPAEIVQGILKEDPVQIASRVTDVKTAVRKRIAAGSTKDMDTFVKEEYAKLASSAFCQLYVRSAENVFSEAIRTETARRGTRVMLAVTRYKAEKATWPAKLDDPALKLPTAVRSDPRSSGDLVYKIEGNAVRLYSVGRDGKDDGGKQLGAKYEGKPGEDLILWPPKP